MINYLTLGGNLNVHTLIWLIEKHLHSKLRDKIANRANITVPHNGELVIFVAERRRERVARPRAHSLAKSLPRRFWLVEIGSQRICRHQIETPRQFCRDETAITFFKSSSFRVVGLHQDVSVEKKERTIAWETKWKTADHREMHSAEEISSRLFLCIYFIEVIDNMFTEWDRPPFISHSVFFRLLSLFFSPSMRANERK